MRVKRVCKSILNCFFFVVIPGPDPGTQVMRVKRACKSVLNFIDPVPACAGMTKGWYDLGPAVKPRDDKSSMTWVPRSSHGMTEEDRYNLGPAVKPRDDKGII